MGETHLFYPDNTSLKFRVMQGIDRFIRVLQSRHIHKAKSSRLTSMRVHHNYCFAHLYSMSSELVQDALCSTINEIGYI